MKYTYDNYETERPKKLKLKIANSRGTKPVLRDIEKARKIINSLLIEINPCDAKELLNECDNTLRKILSENI